MSTPIRESEDAAAVASASAEAHWKVRLRQEQERRAARAAEEADRKAAKLAALGLLRDGPSAPELRGVEPNDLGYGPLATKADPPAKSTPSLEPEPQQRSDEPTPEPVAQPEPVPEPVPEAEPLPEQEAEQEAEQETEQETEQEAEAEAAVVPTAEADAEAVADVAPEAAVDADGSDDEFEAAPALDEPESADDAAAPAGAEEYNAPPTDMDGPPDEVALEYPDTIGQPVTDLRAHTDFLSTPVGSVGGVPVDGFDLEYEYISEVQRQQHFAPDYTSAIRPENLPKNRYTNILPPEHTRVVLSQRGGVDSSDFINANYLDGQMPGTERRYISSQGPMASTFADFWRMTWECRCSVICMLTREIEKGFIKCDRYWPDDDEDDFFMNWFGTPAPKEDHLYPDDPTGAYPALDDAALQALTDEERGGLATRIYGDIRVALLGKEDGDEFIVRRFTMRNLRTNEVRPLLQMQYFGWPDHGIPGSRAGFLALMQLADEFNQAHTQGPLLVHCSAGVGRTGTYVAVHSTLQKYWADVESGTQPTFNLLLAVLNMRTQRPGMVQTKFQYMFSYLAVLDRVEAGRPSSLL